MKWIRILVVGLIIWSLSLAWLEIGDVLVSRLVFGVTAMMAIALPAYRIGRLIGHQDSRSQIKQMNFPQSFYSLSTVSVRSHHSRPTCPMPVAALRDLHSHPTRPMPVIGPSRF